VFKQEQSNSQQNEVLNSPIRLAVVLSGGQAPGGHNVISGVFDFIKNYHPNSQLFGFLGGPIGIYTGQYVEIDEKFMSQYRNQGGFDMICSGRHKIETKEQFQKSQFYCESLGLDGLIVIGGDDSNTNACLLAEYFKTNNCAVKVIGVPKTIDGDLKNEWIEVSFGFDTATRVYSELIGNICLDTLSSKKYYHFIRLMGRSASHIALECALQTRVNSALIGEEVESKKQTLEEIVNHLSEMICERSKRGENYGVILVPEGLIEFVPEMNVLIKEINEIVSHGSNEILDIKSLVLSKLTETSKKLFEFLPNSISEQLLLDRDPHGNVQVAKIDTERLLILLLQTELEKRKKKNEYSGKFSPQSHYFGYEGRCALPSYFDTEYCYALGYNSGALVSLGLTGYMSVIRNLYSPPENWITAGCPLITMMNVERRKGKDVPVIKKALVDMNGEMFKYYTKVRPLWANTDSYIIPGPIQYEGECSVSCPFLVKPPNANLDIPIIEIDRSAKNLPYAPKTENNISPLSEMILKEKVRLPKIYSNGNYKVKLSSEPLEPHTEECKTALQKFFPNLDSNPNSKFLAEILDQSECEQKEDSEISSLKELRIGIVFCGRQAPGGNNIVNGLLEYQMRSQRKVSLFGFTNGTVGMFKGQHIEITQENFKYYRNHGGYDFLGRSVDKIRSKEELEATRKACEELNLDGLVLVGATHTMTDCLLLSDYFISHAVKTNIIVVPSSVDGNVSHPLFESTVGFDTASKVYSQLIGNIMTDSASATKYWYLMRLMGRDPSHLVLECALQTHPNYVIISEECGQRSSNLSDIVHDICDVINQRAQEKKNFGTILIPEGLLSHLPHFKTLIEELNELFKKGDDELPMKLLNDETFLKQNLSPWSSAVFLDLPDFTRKQLLLERESAGTIQLSQIETERLLAFKISKELDRRKKLGEFKGSFSAITHFFGYQGRCSFPSMFDNSLASTYGYTAGILIENNLTGYCVTARGLSGPIEKWKCAGIPLIAMTDVKGKSQYGENKPVIASHGVNLHGKPFLTLQNKRKTWVQKDHYCNPGPIQFHNFGKYAINTTLQLEHKNYNSLLEKIETYCSKIKSVCRFGTHEDLLQAAVHGLDSLTKILEIMKISEK
jgi:diphosphate--fructose-6-phosphate 1-phosphotransferase